MNLLWCLRLGQTGREQAERAGEQDQLLVEYYGMHKRNSYTHARSTLFFDVTKCTRVTSDTLIPHSATQRLFLKSPTHLTCQVYSEKFMVCHTIRFDTHGAPFFDYTRIQTRTRPATNLRFNLPTHPWHHPRFYVFTVNSTTHWTCKVRRDISVLVF
jgi:hypothetical protein